MQLTAFGGPLAPRYFTLPRRGEDKKAATRRG